MTLGLAYSPCPNDTFIFDAWIHGRIDTEDLDVQVSLDDVEALNHAAFAERYPITKMSYHAFALLQDRYRVLDAGSALGEGLGPLLIGRRGDLPGDAELSQAPVAIPGELTTAAFLLRLAYPQASDLRTYVFSQIEAAVAARQVRAGVIIHENRFTYAERGFELITDLGTYWQTITQQAIPLGCIAVRRSLPEELQRRIGRVMARSVRYALEHPEASREYVLAHAQEMSEEVQRKHIATYVNDYTASLGRVGRAAVQRLLTEATERGIIEGVREDWWVGA